MVRFCTMSGDVAGISSTLLNLLTPPLVTDATRNNNELQKFASDFV